MLRRRLVPQRGRLVRVLGLGLGLGLGLWPGGVRGVLREQSRLRLVARLGLLVRMPRLEQARLQP